MAAAGTPHTFRSHAHAPPRPCGYVYPTTRATGVINEETLSAVLSEFARTMATDFPIQKILDHLVERIVEILPITSAGVTLHRRLYDG